MQGLNDTLFATEEFGDWRLLFVCPQGAPQDCPTAVQIERDGVVRARLSAGNLTLTDGDARAALREKARRWIVDYESRPHFGDTDFPPPG